MRHDGRFTALVWAGLWLLSCGSLWAADMPTTLLLFMQPEDALDPVGQLVYDANPLQRRGDIGLGGRLAATEAGAASVLPTHHGSLPRMLLAVPQPGDGHVVYGVEHSEDGKNFRWTLYRGRTPDGYLLEELEPVLSNPVGPWLIESGMSYRPDDGEHFFFTWSRALREGAGGHALWGFSSADGRQWKALSNEPLYHEHDAFGVIWDRRARRFLCGQVSDQPCTKTYSDNMGTGRRRVLSIRTSQDAVTWAKITSVGPDGLIVPDDLDPPEVEFYRMQPFFYGDRYIAMVDLYAPSLLTPDKHGPHLGCQWWVSPDGLHWQRPWRCSDVQADASYPIKMTPMYVGREMLWWIGGQVWGLPENRIASISAPANGAFTTRTFTMPARPLLLNASVPRGQGLFNQAYVCAELRDETGTVISGYERDRCILRDVDDTRITLRWGEQDTTTLAGKPVALRLYLRAARLYALAY